MTTTRSFIVVASLGLLISHSVRVSIYARLIIRDRWSVCVESQARPRVRGFILDVATQAFKFLAGPNDALTSPTALNNAGDIVGTW